jgi:lipoprotein-anchoring transpeptidase ErfK/SrfK
MPCRGVLGLLVLTMSLTSLAAQSRSPSAAKVSTAATSLDDRVQHTIAIQTALDRAGFSPGEIDGAPGRNTDEALRAYREVNGARDPEPRAPVPYTIAADDTAGPFVKIPQEMMDKVSLSALTYSSVLELLAERFHASPKVLQRLNPAATFNAGETIQVPDVEPFVPPPVAKSDAATRAGGVAAKTPKPKMPPVVVTVSDATKTLQVTNAEGRVVMHAPVTVGSVNDPLPVGEWTVNGVSVNPPFHYNPKLFWDADPGDSKATIAPGPNNPVGVVWIDLSKPHYGIHGTPEPGRIGHTESHGCIRLTNWDAMRLERLVSPGTKVVLR